MTSKGIVTYVNNNQKYIQLVECMIDSVLAFTDLPVEVFTLNFDYNHPNKRVLPKRLDMAESHGNLYYAKLLACEQSEFDVTMHIDSDAVVTPDLMNMFANEIKTNLVLMPQHPWNGPPYPNVASVMNDLKVQKTQPYLHAAAFLFTKESKAFFKEIWDYSQKLSTHPENFDESLLNCFLWKYNQTNCFIDCFEPYFEYFKYVKNITPYDYNGKPYTNIPNFKVNNYIAHGCKDPTHARYIFEALKRQYSK